MSDSRLTYQQKKKCAKTRKELWAEQDRKALAHKAERLGMNMRDAKRRRAEA